MSTFLQVVELLLTNDDAKTAYGADPAGFLDEHGLGSFDSADISDAMGHAADALPLTVATQLDPQAGLDSAADVDLDSLGLSLEREAMEYDDINSVEDVDPHALDGAEFGDDVDFDAPVEAADPVDAADIDEIVAEPVPDANAADEAIDEAADSGEPDNQAFDLGDTDHELTELPLDHDDDPTMGLDDLEPLGPSDDHDHDTDLAIDVPDDFDLLD